MKLWNLRIVVGVSVFAFISYICVFKLEYTHNSTSTLFAIEHPDARSLINKDYVPSTRNKFRGLLNDQESKPMDYSEYVVPNIVHYVWFGMNRKLRFHEYLSVFSAYKFIKPDKIYFHLDYEPVGTYWNLIKEKVSSLTLNKTRKPREVFGRKMIFPTHLSDKIRIEKLIKHGGIYLDTDVLVLKSFDPLRRYNYTMGIEYHGNPGRLNSGIIVSRKNATFLHKWYNTYKNFSTYEGDFHACIIPYRLQYKYPKLIHVEEKSLNYPSGPHCHLIYKTNYDFSNNYAMHLWFRFYQKEHTPDDVKSLNTTYGQMARLILYNTTKLLI